MSQEFSPITVCTLWEKDFHKGLGTLVNSLVRSGYRGRVWAGYRGELPAWASGGVTTGDLYSVPAGKDVEIVFVKVSAPIHFSQYKAVLMNQVMTDLMPEAEGIFYFDPDMFILGSWTYFERWVRFGVAGCEDCSYPLNATHPLVRSWQQYAERLGKTTWNFPGASLNSGLVGVTRSTLSFLSVWQELLDAIDRDFNTGGHLKSNSRTELFYATDQDAFTLAASISTHPISWIGEDGMAFERGEWLTLHAYSPKPWRRRVIRDWIVEGHKPDSALRLYWSLAAGPIQVEPASRIRNHRWLIKLVALLSRFYKRT